jgi:cellobiose phosphorylase
MSASRPASTVSTLKVASRPGSLTAAPLSKLQLLSNGNAHVMVTNTGPGYGRWQPLALTRWSEDATCDNWGPFCYLRDLRSEHYWSTTYQPTLRPPDRCEVIAESGRVSFQGRDHDAQEDTQIAVAPDDDIELRRVSITNLSAVLRIVPCVPRDWKSFKIHDRYHDTVYAIIELQAAAGKEGRLILAGGPAITLIDDHRAHTVEVQIPSGASASPAAERAA